MDVYIEYSHWEWQEDEELVKKPKDLNQEKRENSVKEKKGRRVSRRSLSAPSPSEVKENKDFGEGQG